MKKRTRKIAMLCMSALLFVQAMPVWAAGGTEIALNPGKAQEGSQVQVNCEIADAQEVTNGKIRIHYDASKLVLTADSVGGALSGALCEINDCLTGNKDEGEIVAAFASSASLSEDGSLIEMTFQLAEGVKAYDTADIRVDIEELAGDSGNIGHNETHTASITVEAKGENPTPGGDGNKPGGDEQDPGGDDTKDRAATVARAAIKMTEPAAAEIKGPHRQRLRLKSPAAAQQPPNQPRQGMTLTSYYLFWVPERQ